MGAVEFRSPVEFWEVILEVCMDMTAETWLPLITDPTGAFAFGGEPCKERYYHSEAIFVKFKLSGHSSQDIINFLNNFLKLN